MDPSLKGVVVNTAYGDGTEVYRFGILVRYVSKLCLLLGLFAKKWGKSFKCEYDVFSQMLRRKL